MKTAGPLLSFETRCRESVLLGPPWLARWLLASWQILPRVSVSFVV